MDKKTAGNWYIWLWLSPILTLPTLSLAIDFFEDFFVPILISGLWHLILIKPAFHKTSKFVCWHGRQALVLAGIRTAIPMLTVFIDEDYGLLIAIPFLLGVWFFGNLFGQLQARRGYCALWRWFGKGETILPPETITDPDPGIEPIVKKDTDALVEIIRFSTDPGERQTALAELSRLGLVERMDGDPVSIPPQTTSPIPGKADHELPPVGYPPTASKPAVIVEKKEVPWWKSYLMWVIGVILFIAVLFGLIYLSTNTNSGRSNQTYTLPPTWTPTHTSGPDKMTDNELHNHAFLLLSQRKVADAMVIYSRLQDEHPDYQIPAYSLNDLCWFGSLYGYAEEVFDSCENAVSLQPENGAYRDSRGVARAIVGDYLGAMDDFQFFVEYGQTKGIDQVYLDKRILWIADLEQGVNPFDQTTLDQLKFE